MRCTLGQECVLKAVLEKPSVHEFPLVSSTRPGPWGGRPRLRLGGDLHGPCQQRGPAMRPCGFCTAPPSA